MGAMCVKCFNNYVLNDGLRCAEITYQASQSNAANKCGGCGELTAWVLSTSMG